MGLDKIPTPQQEALSEEKKELLALEATGKYLFHGSGNGEIAEFEPRQAVDANRGPDGPPGVFASDFADYAIFLAVVAPLGRCKIVATHGATGVELTYAAKQSTLNKLNDDSHGWVYVFDERTSFEPHQESLIEFVKHSHVVPIKKIRVSRRDLPKNIEVY